MNGVGIDGAAPGSLRRLWSWPQLRPVSTLLEPDPFDEEERDKILAYFSDRDRHYYPLVYLHFWSGLRPGEAIGLRRSDVDLRKGSLTVRRSRTMGEDNAPKTKRSKRTISLRPHVVLALRAMPSPLHPREDAFFFTTQHGNPIDQERFVDKHWRRVFAATGVRPRKFYATRHTFISIALTKGANLKWLATYCGTSIEMIERHYSKWLGNDDDQLALLVRRGAERARRGPQGGPL